MKQKNSKRKLFIVVIISLSILLIAFWCIRCFVKSSQDNFTEHVYNDKDLYTLGYDTISNYVSASGYIHSANDVPVIHSTGCTVEKIFVAEGDFVESGTLLVRYSIEEEKKELDELNSKYTNAEKKIQNTHEINQRNYNQAIQTQSENEEKYKLPVDEAKNTYDQLCLKKDSIEAESQSKYEMMLAADSEESMKLISEEYNTLLIRLNDIEQKIQSAKLLLTQAQSQYDTITENDRQKIQSMKDILDSEQCDTTLAEISEQIELKKKDLDNVDVVAPVSGVITKLNITEGEASINQNIAVLSTDDKYIAKLEVNEMDIQSIETGMITNVYYGRDVRTSTGTVCRISRSKDITTSTYTVDVILDDTNPMLGMSVTAKINTNTKDHVLVVPYRCISTDTDGNPYVVRINNSSETQCSENIYIDLGVSSQNNVEVISDQLEEGQKLLYHE